MRAWRVRAHAARHEVLTADAHASGWRWLRFMRHAADARIAYAAVRRAWLHRGLRAVHAAATLSNAAAACRRLALYSANTRAWAIFVARWQSQDTAAALRAIAVAGHERQTFRHVLTSWKLRVCGVCLCQPTLTVARAALIASARCRRLRAAICVFRACGRLARPSSVVSAHATRWRIDAALRAWRVAHRCSHATDRLDRLSTGHAWNGKTWRALHRWRQDASDWSHAGLLKAMADNLAARSGAWRRRDARCACVLALVRWRRLTGSAACGSSARRFSLTSAWSVWARHAMVAATLHAGRILVPRLPRHATRLANLGRL